MVRFAALVSVMDTRLKDCRQDMVFEFIPPTFDTWRGHCPTLRCLMSMCYICSKLNHRHQRRQILGAGMHSLCDLVLMIKGRSAKTKRAVRLDSKGAAERRIG